LIRSVFWWVKEGKLRRRAVLWVVALGGVLITAAVITLYAPWFRLFDLRALVVTGYEHTTIEEIVQSADLSRGQSLFSISLRGVMMRVAALPWVEHVSVRRQLLHTIAVSITERDVVALLAQPDGCLLLGTGGVVLEVSCSGFSDRLELVGAAPSRPERGALLADPRVAELIDRLHATQFPGLRVVRVDVSDPTSVVLETETGQRILLGNIEEDSLRVDELLALCRAIDASQYASIDLRLGGEATLVPR
jgi:cell division protein FtsQ